MLVVTLENAFTKRPKSPKNDRFYYITGTCQNDEMRLCLEFPDPSRSVPKSPIFRHQKSEKND